MSTLEKDIFERIKVTGRKSTTVSRQSASKAYRGLSSVNPENTSTTLYDLALIKQDLINYFHIRQGEKLENPEFGTIIWEVLFEPMTDQLRSAVAKNVTEIVNYDPRTQVNQVTVDSFETGIQIEIDLTYLPYNISESMRLTFDENNGLMS
jgi:phage baseplate assembly protein W|tara:strand:- start:2678 stop:3130 length:453 start_codon:yes stop_codon:yes gene_type:complete